MEQKQTTIKQEYKQEYLEMWEQRIQMVKKLGGTMNTEHNKKVQKAMENLMKLASESFEITFK
tara:strand:+ start:310 stop:498 length:189 start_codon:yes stop_codon:yes gene_type:complete